MNTVRPERRRKVLLRELAFAYLVLLACVFVGNLALRLLGLEEATISVAGGIVLFLIAVRMIFPGQTGNGRVVLDGEPFLVPLAVPFVAGPSTFAALLLLQRSAPGNTALLVRAMTIAWAVSGAILLSSVSLHQALGERGLIAMERLMGMLLVMIAVQMCMNGIKTFLAR